MNVDEYLREVPEKRKEALNHLRTLCREILIGYEETIAYKMPAYTKNGLIETAFANQKNYISFYIAKHDVMLSNKDILEGLNHGKGCIRYTNPAKIDFDIVRKLLIDTLNSDDQPC